MMIGVQNPMMIGGMPVSAAMKQGNPITTTSSITQAPTAAASAQPYVPPTGLIGSEAALIGGASGAMGSINQGSQNAIGGLYSMLGQISPVSVGGGINVPSMSSVSAANMPNMSGVDAAFNKADQSLAGYNQGEGALKMQADLSGANGAEAQAAAFQAYQSSPAMQYQMEQMQKATERSAAARGGLMSGAVLQELQRNAAGIASQDYQNQFNNLGQVAQTGLAAGSQQAQNRAQQASIQAGLLGQQMSGQNALAAAQLQGQFGLMGQQMQNQASAAQQANALKASIASQIADIQSGTGLNLAGLYTQTGQQLSQGRTQAGQAIAQNASQAASNISQLINQQGIGVSDMMAKDISSITDMIYQSGMQDKVDMQNLAAIIANINGGQASNVMQGQQSIGAANAAGTLGVNNAIQQGLGQYMAMSGGGANNYSLGGGNSATINTGSKYGAYA